MNYTLNTKTDNSPSQGGSSINSFKSAFNKMWGLLSDEKTKLIISAIAILVNAGFNLLGPLIIGIAINKYIAAHNYHGVLLLSGLLLLIYALAFLANYIQIRTMGGVSQRLLFKLRNNLFTKIQELPIAFFNQNKAGDLISRINNDTDKLNQFFSQTLMQFVGSVFIMIGAGIFVLSINFKLAVFALAPALALLIFTQIISSWVKQKNFISLKAEGALSSEIQESLGNFKVIVAFNRRDYFRKRFNIANKENFRTSIVASIGNGVFSPVFDFASNIAQLIVLAFGIYLIIHGQLEIGFLISFVLYINRFYDPLRQLAGLWSSAQVALAGWDRIAEILHLETDLITLPQPITPLAATDSVMEFKDVSFGYPNGKVVLSHVNFNLKKGTTYALVGPTGGGKTTTASIIARLYDPTEGTVLLDGKDIRTYSPEERTKRIGFILQEPFLFTGTVRDNILYGNDQYQDYSEEALTKILHENGLEKLLERFDKGLQSEVGANLESISLGQRQLIAFMRVVLRNPEILILDEATANIDTVTEQLLEEILRKLPKETTRVVIAHRLNTIESADEIFFVNSGEITSAGSMEHAVDMLLHGKRKS